MIFITGYPRSGTTLISNKIGSNKKIYIGPETNYYRKFFNRFYITRNRFIKFAKTDKRLSDYMLDAKEIEEVSTRSNFSKHTFLGEFLKYSANKYSPEHQFIIEKSPAHILYYQRILDADPDAKFIYITRDPRDVIASNLNVRWIHSNIYKHSLAYKMYYEAFFNLKKKYPHKVLHIRYEDFLQNDVSVISKAIKFISADLVVDELKERVLETVPQWELNWKAESLKPVNKAKLYSWKNKKNIKIEKSVQSILTDVISSLGYEKTSHKISLAERTFANFYDNSIYKNILLLRRKLLP